MTVLVMCVRVVWVPMLERGMVVRVVVRFFAIPREIMFVLMVFIVHIEPHGGMLNDYYCEAT